MDLTAAVEGPLGVHQHLLARSALLCHRLADLLDVGRGAAGRFGDALRVA
jgi:hypothetical protein